MLKYKGYVGTIEFDAYGKIFTGAVAGVRSVLTFEGRTVEEVQESFTSTIDLYLEMCKEDGVGPVFPFPLSGRGRGQVPNMVKLT